MADLLTAAFDPTAVIEIVDTANQQINSRTAVAYIHLPLVDATIFLPSVSAYIGRIIGVMAKNVTANKTITLKQQDGDGTGDERFFREIQFQNTGQRAVLYSDGEQWTELTAPRGILDLDATSSGGFLRYEDRIVRVTTTAPATKNILLPLVKQVAGLFVSIRGVNLAASAVLTIKLAVGDSGAGWSNLVMTANGDRVLAYSDGATWYTIFSLMT